MRNYLIVFLLIALVLSSSAVGQTQKEPHVSAVFRREVARLASQNVRLREAFEITTEGNTRLLAATFGNPQSSDANQASTFRLIESDGNNVRTIFSRMDFYFSFTPAYASDEFALLNGTDINGDGFKEIMVQSSSGGNCWSCNATEVYSIKNHKAELIAAGPVQRVADLNGDRSVELVVTDARWENYDDFSHAASPATRLIYTWKDGRYVYASRDFAAYYKTEIDRLKMMIEESKSQINAEIWSDEVYVSSACSIAISYAYLGETERGLKEMEITFSSNAKTQEQRARRARILEDFRRGESFRKLNAMKYGDPMPLG